MKNDAPSPRPLSVTVAVSLPVSEVSLTIALRFRSMYSPALPKVSVGVKSEKPSAVGWKVSEKP